MLLSSSCSGTRCQQNHGHLHVEHRSEASPSASRRVAEWHCRFHPASIVHHPSSTIRHPSPSTQQAASGRFCGQGRGLDPNSLTERAGLQSADTQPSAASWEGTALLQRATGSLPAGCGCGVAPDALIRSEPPQDSPVSSALRSPRQTHIWDTETTTSALSKGVFALPGRGCRAAGARSAEHPGVIKHREGAAGPPGGPRSR